MKNIRKLGWRAGFLGVTALAIALEIISALDGNPDTEPWTELIVQYVPYEITFMVIGGLAIWLFVHFLRYYKIIRLKDVNEARGVPTVKGVWE